MKNYIGIIIAIGFFVVQSFLARGTGMSWDEPQNFFNGRKTLKFFLSGDRRYVDTWGDAKLFDGDHMAYLYADAHYPPGAGFIGSVFSSVLSDYLHLVSWIDGYHIGEVAIGAVGVGTFYYLGVLLGLSPFISLVTTLLFGLYPTIFGEMRADAKDLPMMSGLIVFMYLFLRWVKSSHVWWGIGAAVALGFAAWMKLTAPIVLVPITVWAVAAWFGSSTFRKSLSPISRILILLPFFLVISCTVVYLLWPYLWNDSVARLTAAWEFFRIVGMGNAVLYLGKYYQAGINLPWHYPLIILAVQTPVEILVLAFVGIIAVWRLWPKKDVYPLLIFIWFVVGIGRFALPHMVIYAKIRHFIDVVPAFFLLVGFGLQIIQKMRYVYLPVHFFLAALSLMLVHLIWIDVIYYPYEPSYFNFLVGGTKTVAQRQLFDVEHWATGTREAMQFVNREKGEKTVYGCGLNHIARQYAESHVRVEATPQLGSYVLVPNMPSVFTDALYVYNTYHTLVHTIRRAGADLFYVYRTTASHTLICSGEVVTGDD